ncbi:MAG TPA: hypothetical protein VGC87_23440, partial [Pyrinomonadaceae bacterium]
PTDKTGKRGARQRKTGQLVIDEERVIKVDHVAVALGHVALRNVSTIMRQALVQFKLGGSALF